MLQPLPEVSGAADEMEGVRLDVIVAVAAVERNEVDQKLVDLRERRG